MPRLNKATEEQHHNLSMLRYGVLRYCRACSKSIPQCETTDCGLLKFRKSTEQWESWSIGEISSIILGLCSERCGELFPLCHSFADGRYTLCTLKKAQIAALQGWQSNSSDIEANPLIVESGRRKKAGWDYVG
jgi:predicted nucleic acid-binding Zn ribbon protein